MAAGGVGRTKKGSVAERVRRHFANDPAAVLTNADYTRFGAQPQTFRNVITGLVRIGLLRADNTHRPAKYALRAVAAVDTRRTRERVWDWIEAHGRQRSFTTGECARGSGVCPRSALRCINRWVEAGALRSNGASGHNHGYYFVKPLPETGGMSDNGVSLQAAWHAVVTQQEESPCSTPAP